MKDVINKNAINLVAAANAYRVFLANLGLDIEDPNLVDTPHRVTVAVNEFCKGGIDTQKIIENILCRKFPSDYDEMVTTRGIETTGICPHHFLPIEYESVVGYIPSKEGFVVGLSKLPRLVAALSARPVLQEQLTTDIAMTLQQNLLPTGVGVMVVGQHGCMNCRGINMRNSDTVTTKLLGAMRDDPKAREEFLSSCNQLLDARR